MVLHMKLYVITLAQDWTNFVGKNQTMSAHCVGGSGFLRWDRSPDISLSHTAKAVF